MKIKITKDEYYTIDLPEEMDAMDFIGFLDRAQVIKKLIAQEIAQPLQVKYPLIHRNTKYTTIFKTVKDMQDFIDYYETHNRLDTLKKLESMGITKTEKNIYNFAFEIKRKIKRAQSEQ